jgi:hypothetical protein
MTSLAQFSENRPRPLIARKSAHNKPTPQLVAREDNPSFEEQARRFLGISAPAQSTGLSIEQIRARSKEYACRAANELEQWADAIRRGLRKPARAEANSGEDGRGHASRLPIAEPLKRHKPDLITG